MGMKAAEVVGDWVKSSAPMQLSSADSVTIKLYFNKESANRNKASRECDHSQMLEHFGSNVAKVNITCWLYNRWAFQMQLQINAKLKAPELWNEAIYCFSN